MNPCDHPHGGGEGRSPIGKKRPCTPWGKPTLGLKTKFKQEQIKKQKKTQKLKMTRSTKKGIFICPSILKKIYKNKLRKELENKN